MTPFGFGVDRGKAELDDLPVAVRTLGSWFYDWGWDTGTRPGLEYLACVGAWGESSWAEIGMVADYIEQHPRLYPDGAAFVVGNEIGTWDDGARTARRYARDFVHWQRTLKELNPTYRVGLGAPLSVNMALPSTSFACRRGGALEYIGEILYWIGKRKANIRPDFFALHGYTPCFGQGWDDVEAFKSEVTTYRNFLNSHGYGKSELWMPEFGPLHPVDVSAAHVIAYMQAVVSWLKSSRMVARWAWFALNPAAGMYQHLALLSGSRATAVGEAYRGLQ